MAKSENYEKGAATRREVMGESLAAKLAKVGITRLLGLVKFDVAAEKAGVAAAPAGAAERPARNTPKRAKTGLAFTTP